MRVWEKRLVLAFLMFLRAVRNILHTDAGCLVSKWRKNSPLQNNHLITLPESSEAVYLTNIVCANLAKVKKNRDITKLSFIMAILSPLWPRFLLGNVLSIASNLSAMMTMYIIQWIIMDLPKVYSNRSSLDNSIILKGFCQSILLLLIRSLCVVATNESQNCMRTCAISVKTMVCGTVLRKALRLGPKGRENHTPGQITNIIESDAYVLEMLVQYFSDTWNAPLLIITATICLCITVGKVAISGLLVIYVAIPLQILFLSTWVFYDHKRIKSTDSRLGYFKDLLDGIRVVKLYAWEPCFIKTLDQRRTQEINSIFIGENILVIVDVICMVVPTLAAYLTFLKSPNLTLAEIIPVLMMYNMMTVSVRMLPISLGIVVAAFSVLNRVVQILNAEEIGDAALMLGSVPGEDLHCRKSVHIEQSDTVSVMSIGLSSSIKNETLISQKERSVLGDISFENASFSWESSKKINILKNLNFSIKSGELVFVVGEIESGKSSLLSAILGDMYCTSGGVRGLSDIFGIINGRISSHNSIFDHGHPSRTERIRSLDSDIAYCSQQAWIMDGNIRENILMGKPYDEKIFNQCIYACCLDQDLQKLPKGDKTQVGERGSNLSGGQRQRVSIARAAYHLCMLQCAHSSPSFDECSQNLSCINIWNPNLPRPLVLLDDVLSAVDAKVGKDIFKRCVETLMEGSTRILVTHQLSLISQDHKVIVMRDGNVVECGIYSEIVEKKDSYLSELMRSAVDQEISRCENNLNQIETLSSFSSSITDVKPNNSILAKIEKKCLKKLDIQKGSIFKSSFGPFYKAVGGLLFFLPCMLTALMEVVTRALAEQWAPLWVQKQGDPNHAFYEYVYIGIICAIGIFTLAHGYVLILGTRNAAMKIHKKALKSLIDAPASFFDQNPTGKIMSRFSKDCLIMDIHVKRNLLIFTVNFSIASVCLLYLSVMIFKIVWVPILIVASVLYMSWRFLGPSRALKRMEASARALYSSKVNESLGGASTIRAYGLLKKFDIKNEAIYDFIIRSSSNLNEVERWLYLRLEILGNIFFTTVILICFIMGINCTTSYYAISCFQLLSGCLTNSIIYWSELESNLLSTGRLQDYANELEAEKSKMLDNKQALCKFWPSNGEIIFDDVSVSYGPEMKPILNSLSFSVRSGERIGIVGRTGAGKSSIMNAIFRIIEVNEGSICIDGINIGGVDLRILRSRLSVIPQDPVLFAGTLRWNLDPFGKCTDNELWAALERANLRSLVQSWPDGLDTMLDTVISKKSISLSLGRRQLLCLARAILRKSKILILDEATANVDPTTDAFIQKRLRTDFKDCTILTIAHRIATVIDYDRIMVLSEGSILEFDSPPVLLSNPQSALSRLLAG